MKKLKYGIAGWGTIADIHAQAILEADNCILSAVFTSSTDKNENIRKKYNVPVYNNYENFLNTEIDIVSICTPSGTHLHFGKLAAEAEKHVVVEKPIEVSIKKAEQLIDLCEKKNVQLAVIFQNRYLEAVKKIKMILDDGLLGKVFHASAYIKWFRNQEYYDSAKWRGTLELDGGGTLMNQSIHTIDLLLYLIGDVSKVAALSDTFTHTRIEVEDSAVAILKFKNGAIGSIEASTSIRPAQARKIEIHGEKGTVILQGNQAIINIEGYHSNELSSETDSGAESPLANFNIYPHKDQFEDISDSIINDRKILVDGDESLKSLKLIESIYESNKGNQFIILN